MNKLNSFLLVTMMSLSQLCWAGGGKEQGDTARGKELYESDMGCNVCHGLDATGELGPNIRQTTLEKVSHAMQNFPDMINWQYNNPELFEEQVLMDIVAYLNTLAKE